MPPYGNPLVERVTDKMKINKCIVDVGVSIAVFISPFIVLWFGGSTVAVFLLFSNVFIALPLYWLGVHHFKWTMSGPAKLSRVTMTLVVSALWVGVMHRYGLLVHLPAEKGGWKFYLFAANTLFVGLSLAWVLAVARDLLTGPRSSNARPKTAD